MFDFRAPYEWDEINEQVKKKLGTASAVRVYQSLSSALLETVMGIQLLYSHKKQFHHAIGTGTHAEEAFLFLAKQGIKAIEVSAAASVEIDEKKSLFLLNDLDDALTAQVYEPVQSPAKIFHINVSHHLHEYRELAREPEESEILIFSTPTQAIVCLGKRAQSLHAFFSNGLGWNHFSGFEGFTKKRESPIWVQKVEKEKWAGSQPLLPSTAARIYDRAILYWPDVDSGALREVLINEFNIDPAHVETLSLNRWNETRLVTQFEKRGFAQATVRGSLFLSVALNEDDQLRKKLEQALERLKKLSTF